MQQSCYS